MASPLLRIGTVLRLPGQVVLAFLLTVAAGTSTASAQGTAPAPDDDAALRPAEPDFRVINLPTNLRLPVHRSSFDVTHRFNGNLRVGTFGDHLSNLFGLDEGAVIGLEYRFGIARHLQAIVYRTSADKTIQFSGKYDALHQNRGMPLSFSALVSVEGGNNFRERRAPSLGGVVSRSIADRLALYATPIWVHNSTASFVNPQNTFLVGLGGRARIRPTVYVVGEVSPRVAGYRAGDAEFGFGLEKRAGLHMFQLNFVNSQGSTFGQLARGGFPRTIYLGFNLARKFF